MQRRNGSFCEAPADLRFPNRICTSHAIKVYLSVAEQITELAPEALANLSD